MRCGRLDEGQADAFSAINLLNGYFPQIQGVRKDSSRQRLRERAMEIQKIERGDHRYPPILLERLGEAGPCALYTLGDPAILGNSLLGLICSIQCPGSIIIKTFDAVRLLRDAGVTIIGGFHSPMERECLDLLLRGTQPTILCVAKGLRGVRIGPEARRAIKEGRLLVLSSFGTEVRRTTATHAAARNELVVALAEAVFVPYAAPAGKNWVTVGKAIEGGRKVFALDDHANNSLFGLGVGSYRSDTLDELLASVVKS